MNNKATVRKIERTPITPGTRRVRLLGLMYKWVDKHTIEVTHFSAGKIKHTQGDDSK